MRLNRRDFIFGKMSAAALSLLGVGYPAVIEPGLLLRTVYYHLTPNNWRKGNRIRIACISDPHMGEPLWPLSRLESVVDLTNSLGPDLIVLLGDFEASHRFISKSVPMEETARVLAHLQAPLGIYSILGNSDWWSDIDAQKAGKGPVNVQRKLQDAGIPVLENDAIRLGAGNSAFWLLGLGDQLAFRWVPHKRVGIDDLPGTISKIDDDAPAILLAHEPDVFRRVPRRISLTLSGHTHGGQVRLFGWSPVIPSRYGREYSYGHIQEDGRDLIISAGLGCSVFPIRFGVPPEVTVVDLS